MPGLGISGLGISGLGMPVSPGGLVGDISPVGPPGVTGLVSVIVIVGDGVVRWVVVESRIVVSSVRSMSSPQPTNRASTAAPPANAIALRVPGIIHNSLSVRLGCRSPDTR
jgi:hypothetical protein